jgi:hypothetical protein
MTCKYVSFHFTQEARREMKRNLKRKHLSHERTKGSVDHGKGAAAKFAHWGVLEAPSSLIFNGKLGNLTGLNSL